ncbi:Npt1/Npt2 family nucleotide transporter [Candidatus Fokinia crypta]|uniref:ADP,ATP carrier protein n=1 Tax=Candidatus Fokinia crypta TaxID=1920990 RepID=A0ABZ0UPH2_9RICK|nr:Npt1/Npt2 family nucleotide transporter [Candidatus Fokinia cryptica]WPX97797.1 Tlc1 type NTP/NDP exchange transporter [Candidatus Fokinia cryptica]
MRKSLEKNILLTIMIVFTVFQYSILRSIKDSFVVDIAPEFLSAIKSFVVLPVAAFAMVFYMQISKKLNRVHTYHLFNFIFGAIIMVYGFMINDTYTDYFLDDLAEYQQRFPSLYYPIGVVRYWVVSFYYLTAELYGTFMLSLLFWQIANQITGTDEASGLYPKLGIAAQVGLFASGEFSSLVSASIGENGEKIMKSWDVVLANVGIGCVASTAVLAFCIERLKGVVGSATINLTKGFKGEKVKMSFRDSISFIMKSPEIGFLVLFVLAYGIAFNTIEGVYKKYASMAFAGKTAYFLFNSRVQMWTAGSAILFGLFGSYIGKKMKWRTIALMTPAIILGTAILFFGCIKFSSSVETWVATYIGIKAIQVIAICGAIQNVVGKGAKYPLFDSSLERVYTVLGEELRTRGKAVVSVLGGRTGKGFGGLWQQFLLWLYVVVYSPSVAPSIVDIQDALLWTSILICIPWIIAIFPMSEKFEERRAQKINETGEA